MEYVTKKNEIEEPKNEKTTPQASQAQNNCNYKQSFLKITNQSRSQDFYLKFFF